MEELHNKLDQFGTLLYQQQQSRCKYDAHKLKGHDVAPGNTPVMGKIECSYKLLLCETQKFDSLININIF